MDITSILSQDAHWNVNKHLAKQIGLVPTILLMELIFCRKKYKEEQFYESAKKLEENLCIGEDLRRSATKVLVDKGLISMERKGTPARWYYRLHEAEILKLLSATCDPESPSLETGKPVTSDPASPVTINKNVIKNENKEYREKEERALEIPIKQNFQDPFIPKHDFDGANLVWEVLTKNAIENYKTAIPSDPTNCSAIFQLLISDDKESELRERLLQYEYSWFGENKKTPNAKNVFKSWDQLTPGKVPYYIREGFKTENECLSARRKKAEEKKEEAKPNIDWQALKKKEEERVKQVLAILGETQEMVNGTN